jgi:hypothetical protein
MFPFDPEILSQIVLYITIFAYVGVLMVVGIATYAYMKIRAKKRKL